MAPPSEPVPTRAQSLLTKHPLEPFDQRQRAVHRLRQPRAQSGFRGYEPQSRCLRARPAEAQDDPGVRRIRGAEATFPAASCSDTDFPSISADGKRVAFTSGAYNLGGCAACPARSELWWWGVYVHDLRTEKTTPVSAYSGETEVRRGGKGYGGPWISGNGRYVAFGSFPMACSGVESPCTARYMADGCGGGGANPGGAT